MIFAPTNRILYMTFAPHSRIFHTYRKKPPSTATLFNNLKFVRISTFSLLSSWNCQDMCSQKFPKI